MSIADLYQIAIIEKTSTIRKEANLLTMPARHQYCTLYERIIQTSVYTQGNVSKIRIQDTFISRKNLLLNEI